MTIAVSGEAFNWTGGTMQVTCTGGDSLIEINREGTGWVTPSGGSITNGVIPDGSVFNAVLKPCTVRFTGTGVVSYG